MSRHLGIVGRDATFYDHPELAEVRAALRERGLEPCPHTGWQTAAGDRRGRILWDNVRKLWRGAWWMTG